MEDRIIERINDKLNIYNEIMWDKEKGFMLPFQHYVDENELKSKYDWIESILYNSEIRMLYIKPTWRYDLAIDTLYSLYPFSSMDDLIELYSAFKVTKITPNKEKELKEEPSLIEFIVEDLEDIANDVVEIRKSLESTKQKEDSNAKN